MSDAVEDSVIRLRLDPGNVGPASESASKALAKIGSAGEVSIKQTAAAMRQLPAQLTDVATQLAGGANPLLVLLQQGGQVKDSFGGIGPALRGVAAAITPTTIAVSGLATVTGILGLAAYEGAKQQQELRDTIALTGNAAGLTGTRLAVLSEQVAEGSQQTVGTAREIVMELAKTGQVGNAALGSVATAVARVADVTGQDVKKVAADFAGMTGGISKWAAEHNKQFNFLTLAQYKYIHQLEEQGKAEQAMVYVGQQITDHLAGQARSLGYLETALDAASKKWGQFWSAAQGLGKPQTLQDRLAEEQATLARLLNPPEQRRGTLRMQLSPDLQQQREDAIAAAQQRIADMQRSLAREEQQADAKSRDAAKQRKAIADAIANEGKFPFSAIRDPQAQYKADFLRSEKATYIALAEAERKAFEEGLKDPLGEFITEKVMPAELERTDRRLTMEANFLQQLLDENARAGLQLIEDEQTRGERLIELDRSIALRRARASGLSGPALVEAERLVGERAGIEREQLNRQLSSGTYDDVRSSIAAALRDSSGNPVRTFAQTLGRAVYNRMAEAMADSLARTALFGSGGSGGGLLGLLGGLKYAGSSTDVSAPNYENQLDLGWSPHANGLDYVPWDGYRAMLHRGERVLTASQARAQDSGGGAPVNFVTNVQGDFGANAARVVRNLQADMLVKMQRRLS